MIVSLFLSDEITRSIDEDEEAEESPRNADTAQGGGEGQAGSLVDLWRQL